LGPDDGFEAMEQKLKLASAVLGVTPKRSAEPCAIQSFASNPPRQLRLVRQSTSSGGEGCFVYLKALSTSTEVLALFSRALSGLKDEELARLRYVCLRSLQRKATMEA